MTATPCGLGPASSSPPKSITRSRMPTSPSAAIYAYWWGNGGTCDRAVVADLHIQVVL